MTIEFTAAAEADIADIGDYIRQESPAAADRYVQRLIDACESLEHMPFKYRIEPRYHHLGYRRRTDGPYLIFFRASGDRITIARIVHGARDLDRLLGPA